MRYALGAAHREHESSQSDLSSHGHIRAHQSPAQQRGQARYYGNTGRGSVLSDGTCWEVQVDIGTLQRISAAYNNIIQTHKSNCCLTFFAITGIRYI